MKWWSSDTALAEWLPQSALSKGPSVTIGEVLQDFWSSFSRELSQLSACRGFADYGVGFLQGEEERSLLWLLHT